MERRTLSLLITALAVTSVVTGIATATPPQPGTEGNGLTENESATLWSRDADEYMSEAAYRDRYGESRTPMEQLANGTDITFARPPSTAARWTRNDFDDLGAGDPATSVHPEHAELADGVYIRDAHATIFAVQPSTRGHLQTGETPLYIAPNGTLRGLVDYRVQVPNESVSGNRTTSWSLASSTIDTVRVIHDGRTVRSQNGTPTPTLSYRLDGGADSTLRFEAEIEARLTKTVRIDRGNNSTVITTNQTESVTVADSVAVTVYDLSASPYYAEYPNGDAGVAIFQTSPWQGYSLSTDDATRVRGVWRFYTARDTQWDRLVRSQTNGSTTVPSDAIPVYVHAYPSRIGPRAEPVRGGPELIETWGTERPAPTSTLGPNIDVEVVERPYTTTYGVAVRADTFDRDALRVTGIVRGVNATIVPPENGSERELRRSRLTVEVLKRTESRVRLKLELRDARTDVPIILERPDRRFPIGGDPRSGYISIDDQRVRTNESGIAVVTVDQPGIYTARYHPGSWIGHDPAYVGDTATVRWHPLGTLDGWVKLIVTFGLHLLPFVVSFYAAMQLLQFLGPTDLGIRNS